MKKLICLLLAAVLCLGLCACGGGKAPKEVSFDDMSITSIRNAETGDTLELGMSQGEIEDMIGAGTEGDGWFYYGTENDGLNIEYSEHISTEFGSYGDNPWRFKHGIKVGDKVSDMFRYYGDAEIEEIKDLNGELLFASVSYSVDEDGNIVKFSQNYEVTIFVRLDNKQETIAGLVISKD